MRYIFQYLLTFFYKRWKEIALLVFSGWYFVGWQKTKCAICAVGLQFFCSKFVILVSFVLLVGNVLCMVCIPYGMHYTPCCMPFLF